MKEKHGPWYRRTRALTSMNVRSPLAKYVKNKNKKNLKNINNFGCETRFIE